PPPERIFASGCRPPHMDVPLTRIAHLPDDELCARIIAMGGTPPEAMAHPELRELVLPTIRADFAMVEAYRFRPEPPLATPFGVDIGRAEWAYGPGGKPAVLHAAGLRFSTGHSGGVALIAVGRGRELGVGVRPRRPLDLDDSEIRPHLSDDELVDLAGLAEEQ